MTLIGEGRVLLEPVLSGQPVRVRGLIETYPQMDAGDATLVVLSELHPDARLITLDRGSSTIGGFGTK